MCGIISEKLFRENKKYLDGYIFWEISADNKVLIIQVLPNKSITKFMKINAKLVQNPLL